MKYLTSNKIYKTTIKIVSTDKNTEIDNRKNKV